MEKKASAFIDLDIEGLRTAMDTRREKISQIRDLQDSLRDTEDGITRSILKSRRYDLVNINWRRVEKEVRRR